VTADVTLTGTDLQALYGPGYFSGDEYADYVGDKAVIQKNLRRWLRIIREYMHEGSLVEVGSAYGFFLELAQKHFQVLGYEVSEDVAQYANAVLGVPTRCKNFLADDTLTPGSVDVVALWDVIEHLEAPDQFIGRSAEVLRSGGYLFLTTGDIDSWLARHQGPRWRLIHPPTHLQYFSRKTISRLLTRKGFEVVRVLYPGYLRSIEQILHGIFVLGNHRQPPAIYRILKKALPGKMGIYLNTFDIMYVVARRRMAKSQA
jgi:SAM-dependent methyltransferase